MASQIPVRKIKVTNISEFKFVEPLNTGEIVVY